VRPRSRPPATTSSAPVEPIDGAAGGAGCRLGYRPALDGLRGLFVLAVIGAHTGLPWVADGPSTVGVYALLKGGFLGVDAESPEAGVFGSRAGVRC